MYKHLSRLCQRVSRMTTQEKLIAALFAAFPGESETQVAKRCGLSIARFSNYKLGKRAMDVDAVIGCAQALGWDIRATVAQHEQEVAPTARVKALWKAMAATATLLLVGVLGALPAPAEAAGDLAFRNKPQECTLCKALGYYGGVLRDWLAHRLQRPKPSPGCLEARTCL